VTDVPRPQDLSPEVPFDPEDERAEDEREIDPAETGLPEQLHDAGIEAPEADALDQRRDVPLDDEH
jgi:hypothetical protein